MDSLPFEDLGGLPAVSSLLHIPTWAGGLPADLTSLCTLRDGAAVTVRPIHDDDVQRLRAFHLHLSPQTIFLRFGHLLAGFPEELAVWLTCVDGDQRMAFVAIDAAEGVLAAVAEASNGDIIGITRYERVRPQVAEVATVVADRWQGRGLGPILLYHLAIYGRRRGYATFIGTMSSRNSRAIRSLMDCGLPYTLKKMGEDTLLASVDITQLDCLAVVHSE